MGDESGDFRGLEAGHGGEGGMRGIDLMHGFGECFELDPIGGVVAIALGFVADAPEEQSRMIAMLEHFLLHSFGLACAVLGFCIREPRALRFQPYASADGEVTFLGFIKDRPETIRCPSADAVATSGDQFIEMLVACSAFHKVRLATACDTCPRHDLHRHGFRLCVVGCDDQDEKGKS